MSIPRIDMTFIDINFSYDELMAVFSEDMHTRFLVYEDNTDNVIGIINMKDLLVYPKDKPFSIRNILREPYFTYEYKATADLMIEMRKASVNLQSFWTNTVPQRVWSHWKTCWKRS